MSDGCEEWGRWYWEDLVRRSMILWRQSPSVLYCGIFHLQYIFECTCTRYNLVLFAVFFSLMFWVSQLINQNNATTFCIVKKYFTVLQDISPRSNQTCTLKHLPINVSVLPSIGRYTDPVLILISFVSICMNEPGTVMNCFLLNMAFLLIVECNTVIQIERLE